MHHIEGCERDQSQLLPARVDDYVHAENPVRFIDAFVDGLDLSAAGFGRVQPKETGRPGYNPADLLRLYIYGYLIPTLGAVASIVFCSTRRRFASRWRPGGVCHDDSVTGRF